MRKIHLLCFLSLIVLGCGSSYIEKEETREPFFNTTQIGEDSFKLYTKPSLLENTCIGFHAPKAINKLADIENEYFNSYKDSYSKYYGTVWKETAEYNLWGSESDTSINMFTHYLEQLKDEKPDSMHCTIYAIEALKAGFGSDFLRLDHEHKKIWKQREYAGWSIAYLLTRDFGWTAYLFLDKDSKEYDRCIKNFKEDGKYHVWKQPNIPIKEVFDMEEDQQNINELLENHEFGWGFSEQGWHTWVTRFNVLKECYWAGSPSAKYGENKPLFLKTNFIDYHDYSSHIIVVPPKKKNSNG